jgi:hypothetical protein
MEPAAAAIRPGGRSERLRSCCVVPRGRPRMAEIIQFRSKADIAEDNCEIDLMTAVDVAIRDLRDIAERWGDESVRIQAEECRRMLERAYNAAV